MGPATNPQIPISASISMDSQDSQNNKINNDSPPAATAGGVVQEEHDTPSSASTTILASTSTDEEEKAEVIEVFQEESKEEAANNTEQHDGGGGGIAAPAPAASQQQQQPLWSDCLFMTTIDNNTSLLRLSLSLTADRAHAVTRSSLRCASLITEVATMYETLGQTLQKTATVSFLGDVQPVQSSIQSWGVSVTKLAQTLTTGIKPCKSLLQTQEQAVQAIQQTCLKSRNVAEQYQQRTQAARLKHMRKNTAAASSSTSSLVVDETKIELPSPITFGGAAATAAATAAALKQPNQLQLPQLPQQSQSSSSSSQRVPSQRALNSSREQFRRLWMLETAKFSEAACLTKFALESLQQIETDRHDVVLNSLFKLTTAIQDGYQEMTIYGLSDVSASAAAEAASAMSASTASTPTIKNQQRPQKNNLVAQLLKTSPSNDDADMNTGIMDAETLGLPTDVGKLRDDVRKCIRNSNYRLMTVRALAAILEAVASALAKIGVGLKQLLSNNRATAAEFELASDSAQVKQMYQSLLSLLENESKQALEMASSLRTLRADRCDKIVRYSDSSSSTVKLASDIDDGYWKQLCDAARAQSRAEMKYRQTTAQTAKVRERVRSVETVSVTKELSSVSSDHGVGTSGAAVADGPQSPQKVNKHVVNISKMFSILPDGGEQAMKMLGQNARASIAKHSLQDADTREIKNRQLLDQAVEASSKFLQNYKDHATSLVAKYKQDEVAEWENVKATIDAILSQLQSLQQQQPIVTAAASNENATTIVTSDLAYIEEWRSKTEKEVLAKRMEIEQACDLEFVIPPNVDVAEESHQDLSERFESSMRGSLDDEDDSDDGDEQVEGFLKGGASTGSSSNLFIDDQEEDGRDASEGFLLQEDDRGSAFRLAKPTSSEDELDNLSRSGSAEGDATDNNVEGSQSSGRWLRTLSGGSSSPLVVPKYDKTLRKRLSFGLGTKLTDNAGSELASGIPVGGGAPGFTPVNNKKSKQEHVDLLTEIFLTYFWPDPVNRATVPSVLDSFACSFRDSHHPLPFQYGRVFVTSSRLVFNSWTGKKLNLRWSDVLDLEPVSSSFLTTPSITATTSAVEDTIRVSRKSATEQESYVLLGGFLKREHVLGVMNKLHEDALDEENVATSMPETTGKTQMQSAEQVPRGVKDTVVPPDATLSKMEVVLTKHLYNISIERFYEIAWSEGNDTNEKPLYGPWLSNHCLDVDVGEWEKGGAKGPWCKETYPLKRIIKFRVKRKTHLYIGPPIANVTQTQYCRVENNEKCVLNMTVEFEGIPYSDTFAVEVRWVARREGANNILIQVGVFVDFKKNTFLKAKIRSGTIEETAPVHKSLFNTVKAACLTAGGEDIEEPEEKAVSAVTGEPEGGFISLVLKAIPFENNYTKVAVCACAMIILVFLRRVLFRRSGILEAQPPPEYYSEQITHLGRRMDDMELEIKAVRATLNEILILLQAQHHQADAEINGGDEL